MTGPRFADNGDGTISDAQTGLMWEKKDDAVGIHDKDNSYSWSSTGTADGTAFTIFLPTLNTPPCFAGHCDWRLPTCGGDADRPTGEAPELESLLDASGCGSGTLCVAAAFNTNCGNQSSGNAGCTVDGAGGTQSL